VLDDDGFPAKNRVRPIGGKHRFRVPSRTLCKRRIWKYESDYRRQEHDGKDELSVLHKRASILLYRQSRNQKA
jgi:hypothetical protein